ncbi:MAG TPA: hypothetical protein VGK63_08640, partial [Candidatus Limnocylindrales bacterium]
MALRLGATRDPDWRLGPVGGRRLLFAVTRSLAGQASGPNTAGNGRVVVARAGRRGRSLEVLCAGDVGFDVVGPLAPLAGRFGAELVVRYAPNADDPAVRAA